MIKCSLCNQSFDETDPLIKTMKERHELGMHSKNRVIYSERDGSASKPMGNHNYGIVEWITVIDVQSTSLTEKTGGEDGKI